MPIWVALDSIVAIFPKLPVIAEDVCWKVVSGDAGTQNIFELSEGRGKSRFYETSFETELSRTTQFWQLSHGKSDYLCRITDPYCIQDSRDWYTCNCYLKTFSARSKRDVLRAAWETFNSPFDIRNVGNELLVKHVFLARFCDRITRMDVEKYYLAYRYLQCTCHSKVRLESTD